RNRWGMAASPLLVGGLLVIQADHWGKSYLLGVDAATGQNRWRTPRNAAVNWSSPIAVRQGGQTLIVTTGTGALEGYDAAARKKRWRLGGVLHEECIPTPVVRGDRLWLLSGKEFTTLCVRLGEKPKVEWTAPGKGTGIPSPVVLGEHVYYAEDAGWAGCVRADTGAVGWRRRLGSKVPAAPEAGAGVVPGGRGARGGAGVPG